jgi:uncharacterized membrane protein
MICSPNDRRAAVTFVQGRPTMTDPTDPIDPRPQTAPQPPKAVKTRAWVGWALVGSLCVNLAMAGVVGGAVLRHGARHPAPPAGLDPVSLMRVMRNLPEDRRDQAREILRDHRPKFDALRPARIAARLAIADALAADPLDGAALASALDVARRSEAEGREVIDDAFVAFVEQLSPAARARLAEEIREARRWRGRRHGGDEGGRERRDN